MVRDNRIKTIVYGNGQGDWSGATTFSSAGSTVPDDAYSRSINGEILEIRLNFNRPGSMALKASNPSSRSSA